MSSSLRHIRLLPSLNQSAASHPSYPSYALATRIQTQLQLDLLSWKAQPPSTRGPPPPPTLLSFTPAPTYTFGRRQTEPLAAAELERLRAPLRTGEWRGGRGGAGAGGNNEGAPWFTPITTHAPRGGLTTYHGPGQVVFWPVIDLRAPTYAPLTVRDYACLLEKTTIATLGRRPWGLRGFTTGNPGVWVRHGESRAEWNTTKENENDERKIAALGVHLRRHVTSLGVAINVNVPVTGPEDANPWARIVACGLGDKGVTSIAHELRDYEQHALSEETLARQWAAEFAQHLGLGPRADGADEKGPDEGPVWDVDVGDLLRGWGWGWQAIFEYY
ncbi:Uu.00g118100.m01.CDS01 [Anthostomella pinea]|uniref:Uu.00g118100.m01.CDS01 n=1 Tax=Anthostomella pinea TaxID=933095 RepID=A0AAI8VGV8_9PEZI|nr:Uu.00g118100.m01.CDS01 [Anthostomella pinea]